MAPRPLTPDLKTAKHLADIVCAASAWYNDAYEREWGNHRFTCPVCNAKMNGAGVKAVMSHVARKKTCLAGLPSEELRHIRERAFDWSALSEAGQVDAQGAPAQRGLQHGPLRRRRRSMPACPVCR